MLENYLKMDFADINLSTAWYENRFDVKESNISQGGGNDYILFHHHFTYEVFFVTKGKMWLTTEKTTVSCENSIVIIPPGLSHYYLTDDAVISTLYFNIEKKKNSTAKIFKKFIQYTSGSPRVLDINDNELFYLSQIIKMRSPDSLSVDLMPHILTLLFSEIFLRIVSITPKAEKRNKLPYKLCINQFIANHFREKIRLKDLADELFLCPKHVSRIIRKEFNCSFNDLLMYTRLNIARIALIRTELPISKISTSVGYQYPNLFYSHFKKAYGVSPAVYRTNTSKEQ